MKDKGIKLAYIAGVLDGDGSFSLIKKREKYSVSPLYFPMIQLSNAYENLIDLFVYQFGGNKRTRLSYKAKNGSIKKVSYQWKLEKAPKCLPFLESIINYLIIKKERAQYLRDFIIDNPFVRGSNRLDNSVLIKREKAYIKMREFNDYPRIDSELFSLAKRKDSTDCDFWAYIAGLMDTDGSFSIKKEKTAKNPKYMPIISLSMVDSRAIYYIMNNFLGGNLITVKAQSTYNGFCYRFIITKKEIAIKFLQNVIAHLYLKHENANILLDFCINSSKTKYCRGGISQQELDFRESCYQNLVKLNNNGVYKFPLMDLKLSAGNAGDNKAQAAKACSVNVASEETTLSGCGALNSMET